MRIDDDDNKQISSKKSESLDRRSKTVRTRSGERVDYDQIKGLPNRPYYNIRRKYLTLPQGEISPPRDLVPSPSPSGRRRDLSPNPTLSVGHHNPNFDLRTPFYRKEIMPSHDLSPSTTRYRELELPPVRENVDSSRGSSNSSRNLKRELPPIQSRSLKLSRSSVEDVPEERQSKRRSTSREPRRRSRSTGREPRSLNWNFDR